MFALLWSALTNRGSVLQADKLVLVLRNKHFPLGSLIPLCLCCCTTRSRLRLQADKLVLMTDATVVLHNRHCPPASPAPRPCLCLSHLHPTPSMLQAEKLVLMLHNKDDPSSLPTFPCLCALHPTPIPTPFDRSCAASLEAGDCIVRPQCATQQALPSHRSHAPASASCTCIQLPQIAAALQAEKLVLMTDVPGVLHNKDDPSSLYSSLDIRKARTLIEQGIIAGGMIPKVRAVMGCDPCCQTCIQVRRHLQAGAHFNRAGHHCWRHDSQGENSNGV